MQPSFDLVGVGVGGAAFLCCFGLALAFVNTVSHVAVTVGEAATQRWHWRSVSCNGSLDFPPPLTIPNDQHDDADNGKADLLLFFIGGPSDGPPLSP